MDRCTQSLEMVFSDWHRPAMRPEPLSFKESKAWTPCFTAAATHPQGLLLAGRWGVILVADGRPSRQIYQTTGSVLELTRSKRDGDRFFLATTKGLASIRYADGNWIDEGNLADFSGEVRSVVEVANGDLYFSTLSSGFYQVKLQPGARSIFEGATRKSLSDAPRMPLGQGSHSLDPLGKSVAV